MKNTWKPSLCKTSPESIEPHIKRAGILNLIQERAYGTEGAFACKKTDIIDCLYSHIYANKKPS